MRNPHDHPAVRLDPAAFHALVDRARRAAGHTWPQVTLATGVGIDVFRRLANGVGPSGEIRLGAYLSLATYAREHLSLADQATGVKVELPGVVGLLYGTDNLNSTDGEAA